MIVVPIPHQEVNVWHYHNDVLQLGTCHDVWGLLARTSWGCQVSKISGVLVYQVSLSLDTSCFLFRIPDFLSTSRYIYI